MTTSDVAAQRALALFLHHVKASPRLAWVSDDTRMLTNSSLTASLLGAIDALDKGNTDAARKQLLDAVATLEALAKHDMARRRRELGHN